MPTSNLSRAKLNEIITDRRTSCLAYFIRKGWVEKLWSTSLILQTPQLSKEPTSGTAESLKGITDFHLNVDCMEANLKSRTW